MYTPKTVPPQIIPFLYDDIVNVGDSIDLVCQISKGDKPIQINWSFVHLSLQKKIQPVMRPQRISARSSALSIPKATASHSGTYICTATNFAGQSAYSTNLTVKGIKMSTLKQNAYYYKINNCWVSLAWFII